MVGRTQMVFWKAEPRQALHREVVGRRQLVFWKADQRQAVHRAHQTPHVDEYAPTVSVPEQLAD